MSDIETYYLIDFENVNDAGLVCSKKLGSHNHIHIFSTKNSPKISLEMLTAFNGVDLNVHIIPAGKQSLDMHLIAYLGYLIGENASQECKYVIVSKDNDYNNIISFLKKITSSTITRQSGIGSNSSNKNEYNVSQATPTSQVRDEIRKKLSKASLNEKIIDNVDSLICQYYNEPNAKQVIHKMLVAEYGEGKGLSIYNHIKKSLKQN